MKMLRATRRACSAAMLGAVIFCNGRVALAESGDEQAARVLFREGLALHESKDFAGALRKYHAAYDRWKNPKILTNIGTAAWELGRFAEAADAYDRFLADTPRDAPNRAEVEKGLRDVLPKVGTLEVHLGGGPGQVTVDGQAVDGGRLDRIRVEPGTHNVEATGEKGARAKQAVTVRAGASVPVSLTLGSDAAAQPILAVEAEVRPTDDTGRPTSALPWIVGGAGVATLAASGIFFVMRDTAKNELQGQCIAGVCPAASQDTIDRGNRFGVLGAVTLGVGVVGVAAGTWLLVLNKRASRSATAVTWNVNAGPTSVEVRVRF